MASSHVKTATDQNFEGEVLQCPLPSLIDFWAVWCGPCRALAPIIDELASDFSGKLNVLKLNVDENPETAAKYGIRGIPTVLLFKGGVVAHQSVGVVSKDSLRTAIQKIL